MERHKGKTLRKPSEMPCGMRNAINSAVKKISPAAGAAKGLAGKALGAVSIFIPSSSFEVDAAIINGQVHVFIDGNLYPLDSEGNAQGWNNPVSCPLNGSGRGMLLLVR